MGDITDPGFRREVRHDTATLLVTRKSTFSGEVHTLALAITADEWAGYQRGDKLIQDALPNLTNPQREFLLTGTTQDEWLAAFPPEDELDEDEL